MFIGFCKYGAKTAAKNAFDKEKSDGVQDSFKSKPFSIRDFARILYSQNFWMLSRIQDSGPVKGLKLRFLKSNSSTSTVSLPVNRIISPLRIQLSVDLSYFVFNCAKPPLIWENFGIISVRNH